MPLFLCQLLNIPVPFNAIHPGITPSDGDGHFFDGDRSMPPTSVKIPWLSSFPWLLAKINTARNVYLATRPLIRVDASVVEIGYRFAWRTGTGIVILPGIIATDFIGPLLGREGCTFLIFDLNGHPVHVEFSETSGFYGDGNELHEEVRRIKESSSIDDFGNKVLGIPNLTLV